LIDEKRGFHKTKGAGNERFFALHPPFEGVILGKKARILRKHAL
jgi:hypothetical protein